MKNKPMRRCIGCRNSKEKDQLLRVAFYQGKLTISPRGKGRGLYLCPNEECIKRAEQRGGVQQSLRRSVATSEKEKLFSELYREYGTKEESRSTTESHPKGAQIHTIEKKRRVSDED